VTDSQELTGRRRRTTTWGVVLAAGIALVGASVVPAAQATTRGPTATKALTWTACLPAGDDDPAEVAGSQCATLQVPVDWNHPDGPTFGLAIARRTAKDPHARVGSLVFGPGGPGDSGVDRIKTGMSRFSADLQNRFDVVSFDPRGIGRSNPVKCSAALLAQQPSPVITSQAEFDKTLSYNRKLSTDCRANTGPLYDHVDTLQMVHDLDAIRVALGETKLTFHGSSYGTLLGEQYAEVYPQRVRAVVLESVVDHSLGTRNFLDTQASTAQDSFDEFAKWCDTSTSCSLHGRDIQALWAGLLARAGRGALPDPKQSQVALTPFTFSYAAFRTFYEPDWPKLADLLKQLDESKPPVVIPPPTLTGLRSNSFAVFCQDWSLPVNSYQQYAAVLKRLARDNPEMKYPGALLAAASCLGSPTRVDNPQHRLKVQNAGTPLLLANSIHDPAAGYNWATNVARQLGSESVLLTYDGWGHGSYNSSPCMQTAIDNYLISQVVPKRGTSCPAVNP
jgi:pimeloyl-ACP methyl ester carboxylesterase